MVISIMLIVVGVVCIVYLNSYEGAKGATYFFGSIAIIAVGFSMLFTLKPSIIGTEKRNHFQKIDCPYCGALLSEDEIICEKCQQQLD